MPYVNIRSPGHSRKTRKRKSAGVTDTIAKEPATAGPILIFIDEVAHENIAKAGKPRTAEIAPTCRKQSAFSNFAGN
jgi:phenylpyruvate tautomerase PptA (4-oxalocrotonate tautomerase family)